MIEKTLTSLNLDNMELIHRHKEITKLQSELITKKKMIDTKLDFNIVQKFKLERRKLELLPKLEAPLPCFEHLPQLNVPPMPPTTPWNNQTVTPPQKSSCTIWPVAKRYIFPYSKSHELKVAKKLFKTDECSTSGVSDDDLLKEIEKLDK